MKSASERQAEYQKRRAETESRVTFWIGKDLERLCDALRGGNSRTFCVNQALTELAYRQLIGKRFNDIYTEEELGLAIKKARKIGVTLPA